MTDIQRVTVVDAGKASTEDIDTGGLAADIEPVDEGPGVPDSAD